jgi:ElaB/YqjD/DUF883 family membrane-anchored ribosome-binding protein
MAERNEVAVRKRIFDERAPDRDAQSIRDDIAAKRDTITETVDRLSEQIQDRLDWRTHVADRPLAAVGIAALGGFLVAGLIAGRRRSSADRLLDAVADTVEDVTSTFRDRMHQSLASGRDTGRTIAVAAASVLSRAAIESIARRGGGKTDR